MVLKVLKLAYHIVITPIRKIIYVKYKNALGNIVNISLNIPYKLNFKTIPANIILPDKGDSTWAFNSQLFRYISCRCIGWFKLLLIFCNIHCRLCLMAII